ncbi:DNA mismatch repair protein MutS [Alteracholeplasma palmae J233]|uniref:DNA mismatch repair protein MutS n=1 Tax=Alteracholeplasma palmae (strain ATCC 49389 / J233) TaxID=1318466 RepID=U4KRM4_ALTPJ|nr:DNA mismatch repair protein MutS [Alteracholeplasma palmae]CCV64296.1 DNA mismatch repair protein MutS [Alteracholeplasma palmae J233]
MPKDKNEYTPMMQQYLKIKEDYADAIVFFRLGDFYEMFFDDALLASKTLEIVLTSRDAGQKVPMCGVPHHSSRIYIQKLVEKGLKVAIVEQVSEPGKGLVERKVVKLITPGMIIEDGMLNEKENNFIASLSLKEHGYILSYVDISTGESFLTDGLTKEQAFDLILSLKIKEIVLSKNYDKQIELFINNNNLSVTYYESGKDLFEHHLIKNLQTLDQKKAASELLQYLSQTQNQPLKHFMGFEIIRKNAHMHIDHKVQKHLEIIDSNTNNPKTTLLYWLDQTQTAMGSRKLKYWLNNPLIDKEILNQRYDYIDGFKQYGPRNELKEILRYIYDINRIVGRISFNNANAKDLYQLKQTLSLIPNLIEILKAYENDKVKELATDINPHTELFELLDKSIVDNPPLSIKEGGIIKDHFNPLLDELKEISENGTAWLEEFERNEREKTGIKNLKVGYNRVFGYFIEISRGNAELVDPSFGYERKQTLSNSERYVTPVLKEKEDLLLHAKEKSINLEYEIFSEIRLKVYEYIFSLQELATLIAHIDVYLTLAIVSDQYRYVRPELTDSKRVVVKNGRHPVVERYVDFISNDVYMEKEDIFLITGPNMSGKSTYMRMYALIVYMAQIGSFVPANRATLPIYDAIFTRIGSSDDIAGGKSTFMVEMVESNEALTKATENSLILFDEIGRGTATYDGMALAQGMIEYIHHKIKAQTFFSTHYHELTELDQTLSNLKNLHVTAKEENDKMLFLHQIKEGASDQSYGIQVAKLAHLPKALIKRSQEILVSLEKDKNKPKVDLFTYTEEKEPIIEHSFTKENEEILNELKNLDLNQMTPMDAFLQLKYLQEKSKK